MKTSSVEDATHCLEVDHRALDAAFVETERAARAGSFSDARRQFASFASGLTRHIEAEERVLFPEIEAIDTATRGPTSVMRAEHEELRALLQQIGEELAEGTAGWAASLRRLEEILLTHNTKEERVLYPMADAALKRTGRSASFAEHLRTILVGQPGQA